MSIATVKGQKRCLHYLFRIRSRQQGHCVCEVITIDSRSSICSSKFPTDQHPKLLPVFALYLYYVCSLRRGSQHLCRSGVVHFLLLPYTCSYVYICAPYPHTMQKMEPHTVMQQKSHFTCRKGKSLPVISVLDELRLLELRELHSTMAAQQYRACIYVACLSGHHYSHETHAVCALYLGLVSIPFLQSLYTLPQFTLHLLVTIGKDLYHLKRHSAKMVCQLLVRCLK